MVNEERLLVRFCDLHVGSVEMIIGLTETGEDIVKVVWLHQRFTDAIGER